MILGRPTNLWLGLVTTALGVLQISLIQLGYDPTAVATILAAVGLLLGAVIALVANQPPVVNPGDTIHVTTPVGEPTYVTTISQPPAQDAPPRPAE